MKFCDNKFPTYTNAKNIKEVLIIYVWLEKTQNIRQMQMFWIGSSLFEKLAVLTHSKPTQAGHTTAKISG